MAQDYGIAISTPGNSVDGAKLNQLGMNTSNPFLKIDTQNPAGFQTFTILITTNPTPAPSDGNGNGGNTYTTIGQFAHGYKYVPTVEMLTYVTSPPPSASGTQTYFQDWGLLGQMTPIDGAYFYCVADATNVYFIVQKYNSGYGRDSLLTGVNLQVSVHVFVEDLGL